MISSFKVDDKDVVVVLSQILLISALTRLEGLIKVVVVVVVIIEVVGE